MSSDREYWDWLEESWWGAQRAAALAQVTLDRLVKRQQSAQAAIALAGQLYASARLTRQTAFLRGDMSRFNQAQEAMKKAEGRQMRAQAALRAVRPEVALAVDEKNRLAEEAARWEDAYWHHAAGWLISLWVGHLRARVPVQELLAWYCCFAAAAQDALEAELELFTKAVTLLTDAG